MKVQISRFRGALAACSVLALGGCVTPQASAPVEVTRFHLDTTGTGSVVIEPDVGIDPTSLEFKAYAGAVDAELLRVGFTDAAGSPAQAAAAQFVTIVGFNRSSRPAPGRRSGVSVGLGGGSYGGGVGLGGGVSFPLGAHHDREVILSRMSARIRRRSDATVVWEGRAQTVTDSGAADADTPAAAAKLARALFQGFPGESGRTITVR